MRNLQYILLVILFSSICSHSATDNDLWIFGDGASLKFDSPNSTPYALPDTFLINSIEASATGFDNNGNLKFYSDGEKIWNFKNEVIYDSLKGAKDATQGVTVFSSNSDDKKFFLISSNVNIFDEGAFVYTIDFSTNPDGEVGNNPQFLDSSFNSFERVLVIPSGNPDEQWIIVNPRTAKATSYIIYSFKDGIAKFEKRVESTMHRNYNSGYLRASPNGRFLASADYDGNEVEIAEFDIYTGDILSMKSYRGDSLEHGVYGLDFSENSKYLYLSTWEFISGVRYFSRCLQFDINSYLYNDELNIYKIEEFVHDRDTDGMWTLKRGINNKIYIARENKSYLSVINSPNIWGAGCDFVERGPSITTKNDKSRIGLPSTTTNIFNYDYEVIDLNACEEGQIYYDPEFNIDYNDYSWIGKLKEFDTKALVFGSAQKDDSGIYYLTNKLTNEIVVAVRVSVGEPTKIRFDMSPKVITCEVDTVYLTTQDVYNEYQWSTGSKDSSIVVTESGRYYLNTVNEFGCLQFDSIDVLFKGPPKFDILVEQLDCNDNFRLTCSIDYDNYRWSTGSREKSIEVDEPGRYELRIENSKGCFTTKEVDIESVVKDIKVGLPAGYFICTDEIIIAEILNPDTNLIYKWSNGFTTLKTAFTEAGSHFVEATDTTTGCIFRKEFIIYSGDDFILEIIPIYDCTTGKVTLTSNAANAGFQFLWSNGLETKTIDAHPQNTYSLEIISKEQDCEFSASIYLEAIIEYQPELEFPEGKSICENDTLKIDVKNPNPRFEYYWSNGKTGLTGIITSPGEYTLTAIDKVTKCESTETFNILDLRFFDLEISQRYDCFTSTTILTANADKKIFNYKWFNGNENDVLVVTQKGIYYLEVSNLSGCIFYDTVSVNNTRSFDIEISATPDDTICSGGEVILRLKNKSPKMKSHTWSDGSSADSLIVNTSGTYILTGKDEDFCIVRDTVHVLIAELPEVSINSSKGNLLCENDATVLTIDGITDFSNYDYLWSNGKKNPSTSVSEQGVYTVIVSVKGSDCSDTATFELMTKPTPNLSLSGKLEFCIGSTTTIRAEYENGNITWSSGDTSDSLVINTPGTYVASVDNGLGCIAIDSVIITQNELPEFNIIGENTICFGDTIQLSSDTEFDTYLWSTGGTDQSTNITQAGIYTLTVIDSNGCENTTFFEVVSNEGEFYVSEVSPFLDSLLINQNLDLSFLVNNISDNVNEFRVIYDNKSEVFNIASNSSKLIEITNVASKIGINNFEVRIISLGDCGKDTTINFTYRVYTVLKAELTKKYYQYLNDRYTYPVILTSDIPIDVRLKLDLVLPTNIFYPLEITRFDDNVLIDNELILEFDGLTILGSPFLQETYFDNIETDNPYVIIDTINGSIEVGRICLGDKAVVNFDFSPEIEIYPNPITDYMTIEIINNQENNFELTIVNEVGEVVFEKNIFISDKSNIEMSHLANGSYTLILKTALWEEWVRFNKVD